MAADNDSYLQAVEQRLIEREAQVRERAQAWAMRIRKSTAPARWLLPAAAVAVAAAVIAGWVMRRSRHARGRAAP